MASHEDLEFLRRIGATPDLPQPSNAGIRLGFQKHLVKLEGDFTHTVNLYPEFSNSSVPPFVTQYFELKGYLNPQPSSDAVWKQKNIFKRIF